MNLISNGVSTCAGCGLELVARSLLAVLGKNTVIVIPPGCAALFSGLGRETALRIAGFMGNLENTAAYAAGIRAGFEMQGKNDITVLGMAGDGATVDIGLQSLSGMMERGDRVLYVCYDNEAYMNTGIQSSSSTPKGARTTTTPRGKSVFRKDVLGVVAAHRIPYAASASIGYLKDFREKIKKASLVNGPSYIHVHTPCPTGWFFDPSKTIEVARLAVKTGAWPLFEIIDGIKQPHQQKITLPVKEYMAAQGRFSQITEEELQLIQNDINSQNP
jgi:pyruvate ferredoxin oxidoreductase beta subunit